jgi:hypothetical protein
LLRAASLCLVVGVATTIVPDSAWGRIVGIPLLLAFIALGFVAVAHAMATSTE